VRGKKNIFRFATNAVEHVEPEPMRGAASLAVHVVAIRQHDLQGLLELCATEQRLARHRNVIGLLYTRVVVWQQKRDTRTPRTVTRVLSVAGDESSWLINSNRGTSLSTCASFFYPG
jgi:hypothetical protein